MVQNVISIVYREVRGLHQAAYILAVFTFGSQLLALVRDRLLAHEFGAGIDLDLYYTAFRLPDFLYVLFASTLSVYVLIPFIAKRIEGDSYEKARSLVSQIFSLFLIGYSAVALIAMIAAPSIVYYLFPGFVGESATLIMLMRILLLQPLLLGVSSLLGVIVQMQHRFILYAISPLLYNLGIIFGLLFLYPHLGISGLALGVVIGALGHVCIQLPFIIKSPLAPRLVFTYVGKDILAVCRTSVARALTLSLHQFVLLGLVGFASIMAVGSVSVFQFAFNLQSVPLAIIGVSYSVAAFPLLAQLYAEKKFSLLGQNIENALRHILFWSLPTIALFVVIRAQFVRVILGSGEFDWNDTRLTAAILALFIVSLASQAIHLLVVRALYAVGNTRIPFYVTLLSSSLALILSFFFFTLFIEKGAFYSFWQSAMRLEGVEGIEVLALPLGYSCALLLHSLLIIICARKYIFVSARLLIKPFFQSFAASLFAAYMAYTTLNYFVTAFTTDTLFNVFVQGFVAAAAGSAGYVLMQYVFKNKELREIYRTLKRRLRKGDMGTVVPQDEDTLAV
jgi:putative peptidoglycan lipid II flippase